MNCPDKSFIYHLSKWGKREKVSSKSRWYTYNYFFGLLFFVNVHVRVLIFVWICFYPGGIPTRFIFYIFIVDPKAVSS